MNIKKYIDKYSNFYEYTKSFRKPRSNSELEVEKMVYDLISKTGKNLSSVAEQIEGLDFVVTLGKQRISGDKVEKYQNYNKDFHKSLTPAKNKNGKFGVINEVEFHGWDMKEVSYFLKSKTIMTKNHSLGLKGGWVKAPSLSNKIYYLIFLDIDNKGTLLNKATEFRKAFGLDTFTVETPSGGYHLYLLLEGVENIILEKEIRSLISDSKLFDIPNLDIKMKGYVLAPGSKTEKGTYEVINDTEVAVLNIKTWREELFNRIKPFLIHNKVPFNGSPEGSFLLDSTSKQVPAEESKREDSIEGTPCNSLKTLKTGSKQQRNNKRFLEMFESGKVPEGERNSYLFWTASYIVGKNHNKGFEFCLKELIKERNRVQISSEEFNESNLGKMVSWLLKKERDKREDSIEGTSHKPCVPGTFNSKTDLQGSFTKQLLNKLSSLPKHSENITKMEKIAPIIQKYFEIRFGKEYSKPILTKAVGKFLSSSGFNKKKRRLNGENTMFWNISKESLNELTIWIGTFIAPVSSLAQAKQPALTQPRAPEAIINSQLISDTHPPKHKIRETYIPLNNPFILEASFEPNIFMSCAANSFKHTLTWDTSNP